MQVIRSFSGQPFAPEGYVHLPTRIGDEQNGTEVMVRYIVASCETPYHAILGRPTLNKLCVVVSTYHLTIKFPTDRGMVVIRGN